MTDNKALLEAAWPGCSGYIDPVAVEWPVYAKVLKALKKVDPSHRVFPSMSLRSRSGTAVVRLFREYYLPRYAPPSYSAMPSVGGDRLIPYMDRAEVRDSVQVRISLAIEFDEKGSVAITLVTPACWSGNAVVGGTETTVVHKGLGGKGLDMLKQAAEAFAIWEKRATEFGS